MSLLINFASSSYAQASSGVGGRGSQPFSNLLFWQVFAEPVLADTYTPRSGDVFAAVDREATRIGWERMLRYGRFRAIRKTEDGRYVIAYSRTQSDRQDYRLLLARYVHMAPGYPAIKFLPDLQAYRETYRDFKIDADFIIDATGLDAKPAKSPFMNDLVTHYKLPLNPLGRLQVANNFEIIEMRNDRGRMYASGVMTLGGPYAPVDTFLGLQYAAQRAADNLVRARAPRLRYLNGLGSV